MMKKNLLQKVAIITILVATFALFISSLCYVHEAWKPLTYTGIFSEETRIPNFFKNYQYLGWVSTVFSSGDEAYKFYFTFWDNINSANKMIFNTSIVTFVLVGVCAILGNYSRRHYYISNLVSGLLVTVVGIIMSIITIVKCSVVLDNFELVSTDLQAYVAANTNTINYDINGQPGVFVIVYLVIFIVLLVAFAAVTVYKFITTYPKFKENKLEKEEAGVTADLNTNETETTSTADVDLVADVKTTKEA